MPHERVSFIASGLLRHHYSLHLGRLQEIQDRRPALPQNSFDTHYSQQRLTHYRRKLLLRRHSIQLENKRISERLVSIIDRRHCVEQQTVERREGCPFYREEKRRVQIENERIKRMVAATKSRIVQGEGRLKRVGRRQYLPRETIDLPVGLAVIR